MSDEIWTTARLLKWTADFLAQRGIESPRLEAEILLSKAMGCSRIDLYARFDEPALEETRVMFRSLVKQRAEGMPTAYLIGEKEFFSYPFKVTPDVLIPRPETEHLVSEVLDIVKQRAFNPTIVKSATDVPGADIEPKSVGVPMETISDSVVELVAEPIVAEPVDAEPMDAENKQIDVILQETDETQIDELTGESYIKFKPKANPLENLNLSIVDLGTGSGIIPISLAKNLPMARFIAVDISESALKVAKANAAFHKVRDRIDFRQGDLFGPIDDCQKFDFVVSNPPYIGESEMPTLDASVRDFEPELALCSGPKGTEIVERILRSAPSYLKSGGYLLIEIGPVIHDAVVELCKQAEGLKYLKTVSDLARLPRIVVLRAR